MHGNWVRMFQNGKNMGVRGGGVYEPKLVKTNPNPGEPVSAKGVQTMKKVVKQAGFYSA